MEFQTGKVAWRDRSVGKGNCIYADQRLYCMGEDGEVGLVSPRRKPTRRSHVRNSTRGLTTWTPPVVANGRPTCASRTISTATTSSDEQTPDPLRLRRLRLPAAGRESRRRDWPMWGGTPDRNMVSQ